MPPHRAFHRAGLTGHSGSAQRLSRRHQRLVPRWGFGLRHCNESLVSHVHHFADRLERLVGNPVGVGVSFVEHVAHDGRVAGQLATTLP